MLEVTLLLLHLSTTTLWRQRRPRAMSGQIVRSQVPEYSLGQAYSILHGSVRCTFSDIRRWSRDLATDIEDRWRPGRVISIPEGRWAVRWHQATKHASPSVLAESDTNEICFTVVRSKPNWATDRRDAFVALLGRFYTRYATPTH